MADDQTEADAPQYKAPAKKSLQEIQQMDCGDESLAKYKQTLLAGSAGLFNLICLKVTLYF